MNKQQLASRIWRAANNMRSSIDASEYKDYILGFIFYRYLCEKELDFLQVNGYEQQDIEALAEESIEEVEYIQCNIGYFIAYKDLYSTWLASGVDFSVKNVRDALGAFSRNIDGSYQQVYEDIFTTLDTGLSKLGSNTAQQTKAVSELLKLIDPIPMDDKQGYDVLGFIYEYLISNFAASAGKKAGEFYTPHEVAELMSDIVAWHLCGKRDISIYDPTSGSASLLLTVGQSVARQNGSPDAVTYYAQELKANTYNLTRMNLVMRGIDPANIKTRNADTLVEDWPMGEGDDPLLVDACVSNPPYSQHWDIPDHVDPRFSYGLAPKSKADYAFLQHNLYHLKRDGIMCIVLPHGVLFRGDSEGDIRRNLLENHQIETVIGLPANIFFGTSIPTIVMVLRKQRSESDVLFIDASKGFAKEGNKNKLRARDIRRIFDTYRKREDVPRYAHVAEMDEIRANDYNLNIPRYVDSAEPPESYDLRATMLGGIPSSELDELSEYWDAFPNLRDGLFSERDGYAEAKVESMRTSMKTSTGVKEWREKFDSSIDGLPVFLDSELVQGAERVDVKTEEERLAAQIFNRLSPVPLVDAYAAYQVLDDHWKVISEDLEMIQTEGFMAAVSTVDEHMVIKKKDNEEQEVPDKKEPWVGHVLPFTLVQEKLLPDELEELRAKQARKETISEELSSIVGSLDADELEGDYIKEGGEEFDFKEVDSWLDEALVDEVPMLAALSGYRKLQKEKPGPAALLRFINEHPEGEWGVMETNRNGTYAASKVDARIKEVRAEVELPEDSLTGKLLRASRLHMEDVQLNKDIKAGTERLQVETKTRIEGLTEPEARELVRAKWVDGIMDEIRTMPDAIVDELAEKLEHLQSKYATTMAALGAEISTEESSLAGMLGRLTGSESDMEGVNELASLLGGEAHE